MVFRQEKLRAAGKVILTKMATGNEDTEEDFIWKNPFTLTLAGPTQSGKSTFIHNMIKTAGKKYSEKPGKFYLFYSIWQPIYEKMAKLNCDIEFFPGMPNSDFIHDTVEQGRNDTLVFDDLASNLGKSTVELFNVLSHHMGCNVCFIVHNLFERAPFFREISLNSKYICIMKNPRDSSSIFHFARQFSPENPRRVVEIFRYATKKPQSYLMIDLSQDTPDSSRLMSNIFHENGDDFLIYRNV